MVQLNSILLIVATLLGGSVSHGGLISVEGNFAASTSFQYPIQEISGSWEVQFDTDNVIDTGLSVLRSSDGHVELVSFSILPTPFGFTTFDNSNVFVNLSFLEGGLTSISFWTGAVFSVENGVNDLVISYRSSTGGTSELSEEFGSADAILWNVQRQRTNVNAENVSGRYDSTAVPVPPTFALILLSYSAYFAMRRSKFVVAGLLRRSHA